MQLNIRGDHLRCKFVNICLNVRERVEEIGSNKYFPLPFSAVLRIVGARERKLWERTK